MSAIPDKIESVQKVEGLDAQKSANSMDELERVAPNRENFQKFMDPIQKNPVQQTDLKPFSPSEGGEKLESNPIFADENVSSQKSGSATDQEQKKRQSETEEVEGVSSTRNKKSLSSGPAGSLMDEVKKLHGDVSKMGKLNPEQLKNQVHGVIAQIDEVKTKLVQAKTEIKPAYQTLLTNRLTHIDDNLKIALSKAGVEYTPPAKSNATSGNPAERFLNLLTNSQHQLENLDTTINNLNLAKGEALTPANMLAIQMKMGYVQQQIELFTSLLNKALESTKTIMNVQV